MLGGWVTVRLIKVIKRIVAKAYGVLTAVCQRFTRASSFNLWNNAVSLDSVITHI